MVIRKKGEFDMGDILVHDEEEIRSNRDMWRRLQLAEGNLEKLEKKFEALATALNSLQRAHNGMAAGVKQDIHGLVEILVKAGVIVTKGPDGKGKVIEVVPAIVGLKGEREN